MFVVDDRYLTLVAFVSGCDAATDYELLHGFRQWVAQKCHGIQSTALSWEVLVAGTRVPECLDGQISLGSLDPSIEAQLRLDLLDLIDDFLESTGRFVLPSPKWELFDE
jgi:hypothetical protein